MQVLITMLEQQKSLREQEHKRTLEYWINEIQSCWEQIPMAKVDSKKLKHLAVICDGNRRSATEKGLHPWQGHRLGVEVIKGISNASRQWGIPYLTFWMWSTENWKRSRKQVEFIMDLITKYLRNEKIIESFNEHSVRFVHLGRKDKLSPKVRNAIENLESLTRSGNKYYINVALDYGGLDEIARATTKMIGAIQSGTLSPSSITQNPETILGYLDTAGQPLPDLVIRTGLKHNEKPHTSGFMPLQTSYSVWAFLQDHLPDLTPKTLLDTIHEFTKYERRMGK